MADYYTKFSLLLELPDKAAQEYALDLADRARRIQQEEEVADFPDSLRVEIDDWQFETESESSPESRGILLVTENGGINAACAFIQHLLQRFDPGGRLTFEWSNDCSKPRVDAYGGGAALVTARKIKSMNTGTWLHRQLAKLHPHKPASALIDAQ